MAYKGMTKPQHCAHCSGNPGPCNCTCRCPIQKRRSKCHSASPQSQRPQQLTSQQVAFQAQQQSSLSPTGYCYNPGLASSPYVPPPNLVASSSSLSSSLNSSPSFPQQTQQPPYYSPPPKDYPAPSHAGQQVTTTVVHHKRAPKDDSTTTPASTQQHFPVTTTSKPARLVDHNTAAAKQSVTKMFDNEYRQPYVPPQAEQAIRYLTQKKEPHEPIVPKLEPYVPPAMVQHASESGWHYSVSQQQSGPESKKQKHKEPSPKGKKRRSKSSRKERHSLKSDDGDCNNTPTSPLPQSEAFRKVPQTEGCSSPTKEKKKTRRRKTASTKTRSSSLWRDSEDPDLDLAIRLSLVAGKSASQTKESILSPSTEGEKKHKSQKRSSKSKNCEHSQTSSSREVEGDNQRISHQSHKMTCTGCEQGIDGVHFMCISCDGFHGCEACYIQHDDSHEFVKFAGYNNDPVSIPTRTQSAMSLMAESREKHDNVFCDGLCCSATDTCIMGSRYVCAICPPSLDLCADCYNSGTAHDVSHPFKRFDERESSCESVYVVCPPQTVRPLEREQTRHDGALHSTTCSDCKGSIEGARFMCITCVSFDGCESCYHGHNASHSFVKFANGTSGPVPVAARTTPTTTSSTEDSREKHHGVFCDGANCSLVTCIMGSRYVCADCPPSLDLCGECYASGTAHSVSHTFRRFDRRPTARRGVYTVCPPRTVHTNVFCDGFNCDGSTVCIIGDRYVCADCRHKSVDLCQGCYQSQRFHNPSHSFKRYKSQHAFVLLPPQVQQSTTNQYIHHQGPPMIQPSQHSFHPNGASTLNNSMVSQPHSVNQQPANGCVNQQQQQQQQQQLENRIEQVQEFIQNFQEGYQEAQQEAQQEAYIAALEQQNAESMAAMQQMAEQVQVEVPVFEFDTPAFEVDTSAFEIDMSAFAADFSGLLGGDY